MSSNPPSPPDSGTGDVKQRVARRAERIDFNVEMLEDVTLDGPPELMSRDLMSPYVWDDPCGRLGIMVRAVPRADAPHTDTGVIWAGWSDDGRHFTMLDAPSIVPGPDADESGGVEDPTVVPMADGSYVVYYTGVALASTKSMGNTKEATVGQTADGHWRLFYEYAQDEASRIGLAVGPGVAGPWDEQPTPFMPREDGWDNWHLSTGPMLMTDPDRPVMFYNGTTHDARWRIGWIAFDRDCTRVIDRCIQPLITPPPLADRTQTDIAFAASVIEWDGVWLYYSLEDRRLARARMRRS